MKKLSFFILLLPLTLLTVNIFCNKESESEIDKFLGSYMCQETCQGTITANESYSIFITPSDHSPNGILIEGFPTRDRSMMVVVSGDSFKFFKMYNTDDVFYGEGILNSDVLTITYSGPHGSCTAICTKQ